MPPASRVILAIAIPRVHDRLRAVWNDFPETEVNRNVADVRADPAIQRLGLRSPVGHAGSDLIGKRPDGWSNRSLRPGPFEIRGADRFVVREAGDNNTRAAIRAVRRGRFGRLRRHVAYRPLPRLPPALVGCDQPAVHGYDIDVQFGRGGRVYRDSCGVECLVVTERVRRRYIPGEQRLLLGPANLVRDDRSSLHPGNTMVFTRSSSKIGAPALSGLCCDRIASEVTSIRFPSRVVA
jgi:hypothetical protein